jgi:hypothetical protein
MEPQLLEDGKAMRVLIHQPSYFPWIGLFDLMDRADVIVWYDTAQYTKNDWRNRNRIKGPNGPMWMTIPVHGSTHAQIDDIEISGRGWWEDHKKMFQMNYARAPFFKEVMDCITEYDIGLNGMLWGSAYGSTSLCLKYMGICREFMWDSSMGIEHGTDPTAYLVKIMEHVGGTEYLTSDGAKNYLDVKQFTERGMRVRFHNYRHPVYPQQWGEFVSHLSILDLLFNCGREAANLL